MAGRKFYYLRGGPMSGGKLALRLPSTLTFTMRGETGCYRKDQGESYVWVPARRKMKRVK